MLSLLLWVSFFQFFEAFSVAFFIEFSLFVRNPVENGSKSVHHWLFDLAEADELDSFDVCYEILFVLKVGKVSDFNLLIGSVYFMSNVLGEVVLGFFVTEYLEDHATNLFQVTFQIVFVSKVNITLVTWKKLLNQKLIHVFIVIQVDYGEKNVNWSKVDSRF